MQMTPWKNFQISRMMLGTVQFGVAYGIANRVGKPAYQDVVTMVAEAIEGGVNAFDTAAAYGDSEVVLGRALRELNALDRVLVVTKVRALPSACATDPALAERLIRESVEQSRSRLGLDCLPLVLFHREADARHLPVLSHLRSEGLLRDIGVSAGNDPGPAAALIADEAVSALQVPANLLDRRHARSGIFDACARNEMAVFVRSVYLQGLLLMNESTIPVALQAVTPVLRRLKRLASEAGLTMAALAVRYMLAQPGVTSLLTGVETRQQLRENLRLFSLAPLAPDLIAAVDALVPDLPADLLTPSTWPNAWKQKPG